MKLFFIVACSFCMQLLNAQTLKVVDSKSNLPLEFVTIFSESPRLFVSTNANGEANLSEFIATEEIQIRLIGYQAINTTYSELSSLGFTISMKQTGINMDVIVVSANKWKQSSAEIPSPVSTISAKEIELQNPQTAADLLALSGKVYIQKSQQGGGSPMIRGFATNRLIYSIDGVRMNTAIFRGGNIQNVISLDPFTMENAEVVFGPSSVMYGSDAIGGVMAFQTLQPQLSLDSTLLVNGKAIGRYSSANNENTGHASFNIGGKKFASVSSFTYTKYQDLKMGSNGPDDYLKLYTVERNNGIDSVLENNDSRIQNPSGYSQFNIMQKLRFQPTKQLDFLYGFHYSETTEYGRYDRHLRTKNGLPRYAEWNYGPQKWMMNHLQITHKSENLFYEKATLAIAYQNFEESRLSRNLNSVNREVNIEYVDAFSFNLDFEKELASRKEFRYGVEYVTNKVNSEGFIENIETNSRELGPARYPQADWTSQSVYALVEYGIGARSIIQGGLRWSTFLIDATFDTTFYPFPFTTANLGSSNVTGSIGSVIRPFENFIIKVNLSTAYRAPNVDDVGKVFDSEPGSVTVPNPGLTAEYATNADIGIALVLKKRIKVEATAYYTYLDNALVRRNFTLNGMDSILYEGQLSQVQAMQNAAYAEVMGLQLGVEIDLGKGVSLSSTYNIQSGEEVDAEDETLVSPSRHVAPNFGITTLSYSNKKLQLSAYGIYHQEVSFDQLPFSEIGKTEIYAKDENGNPYTPSWYTFNLKANYAFNQTFSIGLGLENITDQRYRPYSSGISAPGRNLIASLKVKF